MGSRTQGQVSYSFDNNSIQTKVNRVRMSSVHIPLGKVHSIRKGYNDTFMIQFSNRFTSARRTCSKSREHLLRRACFTHKTKRFHSKLGLTYKDKATANDPDPNTIPARHKILHATQSVGTYNAGTVAQENIFSDKGFEFESQVEFKRPARANFEFKTTVNTVPTNDEAGQSSVNTHNNGHGYRYDAMFDLESQCVGLTPLRFQDKHTSKDQNKLTFTDDMNFWHAIVLDEGTYTPHELANEMTLKVREFLCSSDIGGGSSHMIIPMAGSFNPPASEGAFVGGEKSFSDNNGAVVTNILGAGKHAVFQDMSYSTATHPFDDSSLVPNLDFVERRINVENGQNNTASDVAVETTFLTSGEILHMRRTAAVTPVTGVSPKELVPTTEYRQKYAFHYGMDFRDKPVSSVFRFGNKYEGYVAGVYDKGAQTHAKALIGSTTNYSFADRVAEIEQVANRLAFLYNPDDQQFYFVSVGSCDFSFQETLSRTEMQYEGMTHLVDSTPVGVDHTGDKEQNGDFGQVGTTNPRNRILLLDKGLVSASGAAATDPSHEVLRARNNHKFVSDYVCSARIRRVEKHDIERVHTHTYNRAHLLRYANQLTDLNGDRGQTFGLRQDEQNDTIYMPTDYNGTWNENFTLGSSRRVFQKELPLSLRGYGLTRGTSAEHYGDSSACYEQRNVGSHSSIGQDTLSNARPLKDGDHESAVNIALNLGTDWWVLPYTHSTYEQWAVRPFIAAVKEDGVLEEKGIPAFSNSLVNPLSRFGFQDNDIFTGKVEMQGKQIVDSHYMIDELAMRDRGRIGILAQQIDEEQDVTTAVAGTMYQIEVAGTTVWTDIGGPDVLPVGKRFVATGPGTGTGKIRRVIDMDKFARESRLPVSRVRHVIHRVSHHTPTCGRPTHIYVSCQQMSQLKSYLPNGAPGMLHEAAFDKNTKGDYVFNLQGGGRREGMAGGGNASFMYLKGSGTLLNNTLTFNVKDQFCKPIPLSKSHPPTFTLEFIGAANDN